MNAFWSFITDRYPDILRALQEHLVLSFSAVLLGTVVAVPIGILLVYNRVGWMNSIVFFITNLFQTVPSLALLAILIPLLGIGMKPAILALFLYSLMPILRNTYDGFHSVDKGVLNSARGWDTAPPKRFCGFSFPYRFLTSCPVSALRPCISSVGQHWLP